ncbi:MAG: pilus assembly FimT family protein [Planctomycetota bacterium]|jgi:prepilin-type N-terminal cleavage/methylation domain-containing protein
MSLAPGTSSGPIRPSRPARAGRGGFTLLEVMIALVILTVMASIMIPRFGAGLPKREFQLAVDQASDLLTMFAQRQQMQQNPVGIRYDELEHRLKLVILDRESGAEGPAKWVVDPYVMPIRLPDDPERFSVEVYADGDYVDIREWPLATTPNERRPTIRMSLQGEHGSATLTLPAHGIVPTESGAGSHSRVDLDAAGRSRENW